MLTRGPDPGLLVYRFDAPLFFPHADRFAARVVDALEAIPGAEEWLVLDFEGVGGPDATALDALTGLLGRLDGLGIEVVAVARANDGVVRRLRRVDLLEPEGPVRDFATINAAVRAFRHHRHHRGVLLLLHAQLPDHERVSRRSRSHRQAATEPM